MDRRFKKIGSFQKFCKGLKKKRLNENVNIQVDFYDECVAQVLQQLEQDTLGLLAWPNLVKFAKEKYAVLGREMPTSEDDIVLMHIKDLIFRFHSDTLISSGNLYGENGQMHTKGVVIEDLARTILTKVKEKMGIKTGPQEEQPTARVIDRFPSKIQTREENYNEEGDDLPFENKIVKNFKIYSELLEEAVTKLRCDDYDGCIQKCITAIKAEAGSLKYDDVLKAAQENDETRLMIDYLTAKADEAIQEISQEGKIWMKGLNLDKKAASVKLVKQALKMFAEDVAEDLMDLIAKESGVVNEKVERIKFL